LERSGERQGKDLRLEDWEKGGIVEWRKMGKRILKKC
jgi:hypothetical protein